MHQKYNIYSASITVTSCRGSDVCPFLLHDAVLARYLLLSCMCPSVCPSQAGIVSKRLDKSSQDLGKSWNVSEDLCLGLEKFVCRMYKQKATKTTEVDTLRHTMLLEKCGSADGKLDPNKTIDLSSLPPPRVCLIGHIKRTNCQVGIWKRSLEHNPSIPAAVDDNGWVMVGESIEPKWCEGEVLQPV